MRKTNIFLALFTLASSCALPMTAISISRNVVKEAAMTGKVSDVLKERFSKKEKPLSRITPATDVITEVKGQETLYYKYCVGTYGFYDDAFFYDGDFATTVTRADNGDVYFYNILCLADYPTYVKGEMNDDVITISLPQTVYFDESTGECVNLVIVKAHDFIDESGREALEYLPDYSIESVTYNVNDAGELELVCPGDPYNGDKLPDYAIGYVYQDNDEWLGFCDFVQKLTPFDGSITTIPEGVETEEYTFLYADYGKTVLVAFDDDMLYVKGMNPNIPEGTFCAKIIDNKAYVDQNIIMGIYDNCFMYTKCVYDNPDYDWEIDNGPEFIFAPEDVKYVFDISPDRNIISSADKDMYLCLNGSIDRLYYLAAYRDFEFFRQASFAGVPANPYEPYWYSEFSSRGSASFFFWVPSRSTEDNLLDVNSLYYRIYVDGEIKVFQQEENPSGRPVYYYPGLEEPTTLIPYEFTNWQDIYVYADTSRRMVDVYTRGLSTIGVQSVYIYDGVTTVSDILSYNISTGQSEYITEEEAGVSSITHAPIVKGVYNLQGIKLLDEISSAALETLPKGIYVIDGRKVTIR